MEAVAAVKQLVLSQIDKKLKDLREAGLNDVCLMISIHAVQRSAKMLVRGCEKFDPALA